MKKFLYSTLLVLLISSCNLFSNFNSKAGYNYPLEKFSWEELTLPDPHSERIIKKETILNEKGVPTEEIETIIHPFVKEKKLQFQKDTFELKVTTKINDHFPVTFQNTATVRYSQTGFILLLSRIFDLSHNWNEFAGKVLSTECYKGTWKKEERSGKESIYVLVITEKTNEEFVYSVNLEGSTYTPSEPIINVEKEIHENESYSLTLFPFENYIVYDCDQISYLKIRNVNDPYGSFNLIQAKGKK